MKIKISLFKLAILITLVFFSGYYVRSIHYRQDTARVLDAQAELRTEYYEIKREFMPIVESAVKAIEDYEEIMEWKRASSAIPFEEEEL